MEKACSTHCLKYFFWIKYWGGNIAREVKSILDKNINEKQGNLSKDDLSYVTKARTFFDNALIGYETSKKLAPSLKVPRDLEDNLLVYEIVSDIFLEHKKVPKNESELENELKEYRNILFLIENNKINKINRQALEKTCLFLSWLSKMGDIDIFDGKDRNIINQKNDYAKVLSYQKIQTDIRNN